MKPLPRINVVTLFPEERSALLTLLCSLTPEPWALVQAVQRNRERFPNDFMFQLTAEDFANLKSQIVISSRGWGGRRSPPYAFTEQGVAMLSSVLLSQRAVQVNIEIMRSFVRLREMLASNRDLARRLNELEKRYDAQLKAVFDAIRQLMAPPVRANVDLGSVRSPRIEEKAG